VRSRAAKRPQCTGDVCIARILICVFSLYIKVHFIPLKPPSMFPRSCPLWVDADRFRAPNASRHWHSTPRNRNCLQTLSNRASLSASPTKYWPLFSASNPDSKANISLEVFLTEPSK